MALIELPAYTVSTKDAISDLSWTQVDDLYLQRLSLNLAPGIDEADLLWQFGTIDGAYVANLDLAGKYVRIECADPAIDWVGYVLGKRQTRWGQEDDGGGQQRLTGGDSLLRAVGLEWFIGRKIIASDKVKTSSGTATINRAIGFNTGSGAGRGVELEPLENKSTAGSYFELGKIGREAWSIKEAVEYLLDFHAPQDKDGNIEPVAWDFDAPASLLTYLNAQPCPPTPTEGRSVLQVLNTLLSPRRGLQWRIEWFNGFSTATVTADTLAPSNVSLPGGLTLPANSDQTTLAPDAETELTSCNVEVDYSRRYDQVIVRGARKRAVFTVSQAASNLEAGWSSAQETTYIAGASGDSGYGALSDDDKKRANDRVREAGELERVYQVYRIPDNWDGRSNDGSTSGTKQYACPNINYETGSIIGGSDIAMPGLRLLPTLPLVAGWDYFDATNPTDGDGSDANYQWQRPFAVIDAGEASTQWRFVHAINTTDEDDGSGGTVQRRTSYHMRALPGEPAFQLVPGGGLSHALAKNHFNDATDPPSNYATELDYAGLRATVCGEWDEYCEGTSPLAGSTPSSDPLDTLYISIGTRARFDYLAAGTIYDCRKGALKTVSVGGLLRDDRDLCHQIATIAHEWYATDRGTVSLTLGSVVTPVTLGQLVTTVGTAEAAETVNAVVSRVTYDFAAGRASISCGFEDLDFAGLA